MKKKVILLHPRISRGNVGGMPLAPLALAAVLETQGYEPVIIDQPTEGEDWPVAIARHIDQALWVGITAISGDQVRYGLQMADYIRRISPATPIVWGGRHATSLPEQTVSDRRVDIVVRGEGETVVVELTRALESQSSLEEVRGLTYKENGQVHSTPNSEYVLDLDSLPSLPWHRFDLQRFFASRSTRHMGFQSGRGCPYTCRFCSHKSDVRETFRSLSAERILDTIEPVVREHKVDVVELYEPFFVAKKSRVAEFCEGILKRGLKLEWTGSARANNFWKLPPDLLALMKRSGCRMLTFGFESGSPDTLRRIDKRITVEDIIKSAEACHQHGIIPDACFIGGFPGDSAADDLATLRTIGKIRQICPRIVIHFQIYTAFPGSLLYDEAVRDYGLKPLESLEAWGHFSKWKHVRPWLSPVRAQMLRLANGSIYASDLDYLVDNRKDLPLARPLHAVTDTGFKLLERASSLMP